ncbi:MAG: hypothetical protein C4340_01945, partial [Armatimonadota bacterium]
PLPYLGMDRFVEVGDALDVFDIPGARIGILICFDVRIPEAARTLALKGADILCVPTNWPQQAILTSNCVCPARASENQTFVIAADRVGEENEVRFLGYSKIIAPGGCLRLRERDSLEHQPLSDRLNGRPHARWRGHRRRRPSRRGYSRGGH